MIEARQVCKSFGSINPVRDVSLVVGKGMSLCIVGRSGCGKTTLLKLLGSIMKPDSGEVIIDGNSMTQLGYSQLAKMRSKIGYSFQEPLLLPYLTALENVITPLPYANRSLVKQKAIGVLSRLDLSARLAHYPAKLSVGEKKRVDLSRALVKKPTVLIADEPFSNLDQKTSRKVREVLAEYVGAGGTLVYSVPDASKLRLSDDTFKME